MILYKLVLMGDGGVGKTTAINQLYPKRLDEPYDPTWDGIFRRQVVIDAEPCMLELQEVPSQVEYTAMRDYLIRQGEGFVLVYSITSRASFSRIAEFHNQINTIKLLNQVSPRAGPSLLASPVYNTGGSPHSMPIMLVGNKSDKTVERVVSTEEGKALAKGLGYGFVEVSAENHINIEKAFYDVIRMLRQQRQPQDGRAEHGNQQAVLPDRSPHCKRFQCILL